MVSQLLRSTHSVSFLCKLSNVLYGPTELLLDFNLLIGVVAIALRAALTAGRAGGGQQASLDGRGGAAHGPRLPPLLPPPLPHGDGGARGGRGHRRSLWSRQAAGQQETLNVEEFTSRGL